MNTVPPAQKQKLTNAARGAMYMCGAAFCFAFMNTMVRFATDSLPPIEVAFFRNLFALTFMLPLFYRYGRDALKTAHPGLQVLRAITGVVAMVLWFTSISLVPLTEAVALNFTLPLFAILGAAFVLREKVGMRRWVATAVGFSGMLVILRPGFQEVTAVMALPVLAAVFMAIGIVILKKVSADDKPSTSVLFMNLLMTPMSLIPALFVWRWPDLQTLALLAMLGFFAMFAHMMLARASAAADASIIMPFDYLRLPFIAFFAYIVFAEVADIWTWSGAGIIAASAIYIARRESQIAKKTAALEIAAQAGLVGRSQI